MQENHLKLELTIAYCLLGELEKENKIALENYFKEIFIKNERGNWVNPKEKTDLVLIWWKKEEI